jgi:hypothetical protein
MEQTVEKMAEDINLKIEGFKSELANAATKEAVEAIKTSFDDFVAKNTTTSEASKVQLDDLAEQIAIVKDNTMGQGSNAKKGYFVEFVEKNIDESKPATNASHKAELKIEARDLFVDKTPALMTTANVLPNVADGFNQLFGNYIDSTIYSTPKPETFILPLVDVTTQVGTESIWYVDRINQEGDAAFIGEGDPKPLADAEWQERKAPIKEVAVFWKFSKRLAQNAPSVVTDFRTHADELVDQKIDDGVLEGDNLNDNLNGIITAATSFVVPTQLANYYADANIYDAIMAMATKVRLGNYKGEITAVLNTVWKAKMAGIKNTDGDYIVPPFVSRDGNDVGEVKVVFSNKLADDSILVGDLKVFKVVISQNVEYYEGYENDDFRKNLMSKKLEAFLGTYLPSSNADAIIYDSIATVLTAIEVAAPSV